MRKYRVRNRLFLDTREQDKSGPRQRNCTLRFREDVKALQSSGVERHTWLVTKGSPGSVNFARHN